MSSLHFVQRRRHPVGPLVTSRAAGRLGRVGRELDHTSEPASRESERRTRAGAAWRLALFVAIGAIGTQNSPTRSWGAEPPRSRAGASTGHKPWAGESVPSQDRAGAHDRADSGTPPESLAGLSLSPGGIEATSCAVKFARVVSVPSLESGQVSAIVIRQGQLVPAGSTLLKLDTASLDLRRRAAKIALEAAIAESSDTVERAFAETAFAEAEAELKSIMATNDDLRAVVPENELRQKRLAVERARLEIRRAEKMTQRGLIASQQRELELALIDQAIANLTTRSPINGVVLAVQKQVGEWVESGQTVATVAECDTLHVHAFCDSTRLPLAACRGASVRVFWVDSATGRMDQVFGRVSAIDPQVLGGGQYRFHATVRNQIVPDSNGGWRLTQGTRVRMEILPTESQAEQSAAPKNWKLR